jgi:hypothetical protein
LVVLGFETVVDRPPQPKSRRSLTDLLNRRTSEVEAGLGAGEVAEGEGAANVEGLGAAEVLQRRCSF